MQDRIDLLESQLKDARAEVDRLTEINADAAIRLDDRLLRIEKAEAALAAVAALHDEYDGPHTYCHDCGGLTPCATRRALRDASEGGGSDG